MVKLGVLGLQGAFIEHVDIINLMTGCNAITVKSARELSTVDAIILPGKQLNKYFYQQRGGESTAIYKLAKECGLVEPLVQFIASGKPVWVKGKYSQIIYNQQGTCAGLILLSNTISKNSQGTDQLTLGGLDIVVERNAFGTQADSFIQPIAVTCVYKALTSR